MMDEISWSNPSQTTIPQFAHSTGEQGVQQNALNEFRGESTVEDDLVRLQIERKIDGAMEKSIDTVTSELGEDQGE